MIRFAIIAATSIAVSTTPVAAQNSLEEGLKALLQAAIESQLKPKPQEEEPQSTAQEVKPKADLLAEIQPSSTAQLQAKLDTPFDARELNREEKRLLQAGLALGGYYNALLDGAWGRGSQGSMVSMARAEHRTSTPTWQHAVDLQDKLAAEVLRNGWQATGTRDNAVSVLLPMRLMRSANTRRGVAWQSVRRDMQVRILPQSLDEAVTLANAIRARHEGRGEAYFRQNGDRVVVSTELANGGGIYMRNFESRRGLRTALIEWDASAQAFAKLTIASLRGGPQNGLEPNKDGLLDKLVLASKAPVQAVPSNNNDSFWPAEEDEPSSILRDLDKPAVSVSRSVRANGVYVNNTDILTASYPLRNCQSIFIGQGIPATIVATDPKTGLAIVTSSQRRKDWIELTPQTPRNDDNLVSVGYRGPSETATLRARQASAGSLSRSHNGPGDGILMSRVGSNLAGGIILTQNRVFGGLMLYPRSRDLGARSRLFASGKTISAFLNKQSILHMTRSTKDARPMSEDRLKAITTRVSCAD